MSIDTTVAVTLSLSPYRESSSLVVLFTNNHGLVHGIAKGIRQKSKRTVALERGFLIEHIIYFKPGHDLHTLADIRIAEYFPGIRGNLEKTAIRDTAFEMLLCSVTLSEANPALYALITKLLFDLDGTEKRENSFMFLWKFLFDFAYLMGFGLSLDCCAVCKSQSVANEGGFLLIEKGAIACCKCYKANPLSGFIPSGLIPFLENRTEKIVFSKALSRHEFLRLTRLAVSYCRFHLDIRKELKTVDFLQEMIL